MGGEKPLVLSGIVSAKRAIFVQLNVLPNSKRQFGEPLK